MDCRHKKIAGDLIYFHPEYAPSLLHLIPKYEKIFDPSPIDGTMPPTMIVLQGPMLAYVVDYGGGGSPRHHGRFVKLWHLRLSAPPIRVWLLEARGFGCATETAPGRGSWLDC